jgi:hypothetical protein
MPDPQPPSGIDPTTPNPARMYDYALGGKYHYQADRDLVHQALQVWPAGARVARENRAFNARAVRYLAETCGIRQFIDHGSGLPTKDNVHQVAQGIDPAARVVYVDKDPVVLVEGQALLAENPNTAVVTADMAQPDTILTAPDVRRLINFTQPVGVLFVSVLHGLPDDADPWGAVARIMAAVPSGSYLVVSDVVSDDKSAAAELQQLIYRNWGWIRAPEQIERLFEGLEVVEPGLGDVVGWRPDLGPTVLPWPSGPAPDWAETPDPGGRKLIWEHGGVARKPS